MQKSNRTSKFNLKAIATRLALLWKFSNCYTEQDSNGQWWYRREHGMGTQWRLLDWKGDYVKDELGMFVHHYGNLP